jgi:Tol biopolymer transport system component
VTLSPGTRLGPYEIQSALGAGGMGEVYRAHDTKLGRDVALKILPDAFAQNADRLARFQREAHVLAALNHSGIAHIYGLEEASGQTALVMELVEGPTLADRIVRGPIPLDEAVPIAKQMAEALEAAHEQGIIHRDLKPANVKVREDGTVKVLDFGLAKAIEPVGAAAADLSESPTVTSPAVTARGVILGTAAYMAPEQAKGRTVDKRADVWAFGVVLYEMLTGRRPFAGSDVSEVLASVLAREPDWSLLPVGLSPVLETYTRRCLHKDPKHRIHDIGDVRLALEGAFETKAPQAAAVAVVQPVWRRALPFAAATAVVALLLAGLAAWSLWPTVSPQVVGRFVDLVQADRPFRTPGRTVVALSPDGRAFVYNAQGGLFLRTIDNPDARPIPGTEDALVNPFFSPDGQSVGFYQSFQLKRLPVGGGTPVTICPATYPFGVSWEADGTILFGQPAGILPVSAEGGAPEVVIQAGEGEQVYGPHQLPGGDAVLFSTTTTTWGEAQVVAQSLGTGARTVLVPRGHDARYVPTGHLIYAQGDVRFGVAFDVARLAVTGAPVSLVRGVGTSPEETSAAFYAVSDTGTLVFATGSERVRRRQLVWVDRQRREDPLAAPPRPYLLPRLSPDGTRVVVCSADQERDLWLWDLLGRRPLTRLTFDPKGDDVSVWTPDGRSLVFSSARDDGHWNLWMQAADGTGPARQLTTSTNPQNPTAITPDRTQIVFDEMTADRQHDPWLLTLGESPAGTRAPGGTSDSSSTSIASSEPAPGGSVRTLLDPGSDELGGVVSPDGRWIAYESTESINPTRHEIYVRPFPRVGEGHWQISQGGGRQALWSRDGRELFYVAPRGALMAVPVSPNGLAWSASTPTTLIEGRYLTGAGSIEQYRQYDVTADGKRFLMVKVDPGD